MSTKEKLEAAVEAEEVEREDAPKHRHRHVHVGPRLCRRHAKECPECWDEGFLRSMQARWAREGLIR
jgi:hypothetical protein